MKSATVSFVLLVTTPAVFLLAQSSPLPQYPAAVSIGLDASGTQQCGWYKGNRITISARSKSEEGETTDSLEIYNDKTILITETEHIGKLNTKHQILLLDGYWMLARNADLPKDAEIDYLDSPLLFLKLALELLCMTAGGPPENITQTLVLDLKEKKHVIEVKSGAAGLEIGTPWSLLGKVDLLDQGRRTFDSRVDFKHEEPGYVVIGGERIKLDQKEKARREEMLLSGRWQYDVNLPGLADDMPLEGWQIFSIGLIKRQERGMMYIDFGARPSDVRPKSIGDLRKLPHSQ